MTTKTKNSIKHFLFYCVKSVRNYYKERLALRLTARSRLSLAAGVQPMYHFTIVAVDITGCSRCVLFSAVSEADSVVKVAEWQQTYYATDSGIQSGATTVQDDESSTEYSGNKKYTNSTTTGTDSVPVKATVGGGGDSAFSGVDSPTGNTF